MSIVKQLNRLTVRFSIEGIPEALFDENSRCRPFMSLTSSELIELEKMIQEIELDYLNKQREVYNDCPF